jgi:hypothetical protein
VKIEGSQFKVSPTKVNETLSQNKPGVVIHARNPSSSYLESVGRKIVVQDQPYLKN